MNPEAQRIAIAKACGWKVQTIDGQVWCEIKEGVFGLPCDYLPDYCNDLNAIHDAVMTMSEGSLEYSMYCSKLNEICAIENSKHDGPSRQTLDATAAQRAEALLKTVGKWEGGSDEEV